MLFLFFLTIKQKYGIILNQERGVIMEKGVIDNIKIEVSDDVFKFLNPLSKLFLSHFTYVFLALYLFC